MRPIALALQESGIATWNIEYRRAGSEGGGWPGTYLDLAKAVDFLRTIAGKSHLDLTNVAVVGHSSGGQLAFWIVARHRLPAASPLYTGNPLRMKAAVNLDGPPDLQAAQPLETKFCPLPAITKFLGGTPAEQPERYKDGSATAVLPIGVEQIIIAGGLLRTLPQLAQAYEAAAKGNGDRISIQTLDGSGHFEMLFPESPQGRAVIERLRVLLLPGGRPGA